jgi:SEC-C motif-containing protein
MNASSKPIPCPCGAKGQVYGQCCGRFIEDGEIPHTAQELMRSRYSAYTLGKDDYLKATWHPSRRPAEERLSDPDVKWLGLEVRKHVPMEDKAEVEFVARYRANGRAYRLHETSRFARENGQWFYVDGSFHEKK